MNVDKNKKLVNRKTFLSDIGKTIFYAGLSASVLSALINTGCTKDEDDEEATKLENGCETSEHICTISYSCISPHPCVPPTFSCIPTSAYTHRGGVGF